jgi:hypothetical protein
LPNGSDPLVRGFASEVLCGVPAPRLGTFSAALVVAVQPTGASAVLSIALRQR